MEQQNEADQEFIREALIEADKAARIGEVPIGALIVIEGKVIARAHNLKETTCDPTAHAEILAIRTAAQFQQGWRLSGATLYTTLEPCPMCAGAMLLARIERLVYGASDPKAGSAGTLMNIVQDERFNHKVEITAGILASECGNILKEFFRERRFDNQS
ncbi:MAG TPA: tRNA-specific adenosine deaminase [Firmicutes bacterium]|nr:tRNA-specific adenosine deaminase [Bacillota bacterium]